ncbi:hypothetical protein ACFWOG_29145 [Kitasatospora sp. NPDC058406]|uniref:hypothetical protein n=1 Tax=Kitasatospora sp. NPDC058406 TaxID=3346483 RepID=UPI00365A1035
MNGGGHKEVPARVRSPADVSSPSAAAVPPDPPIPSRAPGNSPTTLTQDTRQAASTHVQKNRPPTGLTGRSLDAIKADPAVRTVHIAGSVPKPGKLTVPVGADGRFVRVQLAGTG